MNSTFTNSTDPVYSEKVFILVTLVRVILSIHFLLGFSLSCYIIVFLLSKGGGGHVSVVFAVNSAVAEILFSCLSLLFVIVVEICTYFIGKLLDFIFGTSVSARLLFQCCVSLERYLAVVHPVAFLRFKPPRYRVACSAAAWICALVLGVASCTFLTPYTVLVAVNVVILLVEFFCCVSILRKLRRPGPRDVEREQAEMSATKKKAFQIVSINLLTCLAQNIPTAASYSLEYILPYYDFSMVTTVCTAVNMFVGFVQPLFILYKAGKLPFLRCS